MTFATKTELAIPTLFALCAPCQPQPTGIRATRSIYLRPEPFKRAIIGVHRKVTPFGAMRSEANPLATAFLYPHTHSITNLGAVPSSAGHSIALNATISTATSRRHLEHQAQIAIEGFLRRRMNLPHSGQRCLSMYTFYHILARRQYISDHGNGRGRLWPLEYD